MVIRIIGCGKIGSIFARILAQKHTLILESRNNNKRNQLEIELNLFPIDATPQITILAVKPQDFDSVCKQYSFENQMVISALAGITLAELRKNIKSSCIFKIVPNLACSYGKGIIGIAKSEESKSNQNTLEEILKPFGDIFWIEERKFNAFTSLTSSGPAFISLFIEAMVDSGIAMGFSSEDSLNYIFPMIEGTLNFLQTSGTHPSQFKWDVCSPMGMTIEGIKALEQSRIRSGIINAFLAVKNRGDELSQQTIKTD